jgi:hypothetical protein
MHARRLLVTDAAEDEPGTVLLDVADDGVATLTLNRPHRHNAWNPVLERRCYQLLDEADDDDRVRTPHPTPPLAQLTLPPPRRGSIDNSKKRRSLMRRHGLPPITARSG